MLKQILSFIGWSIASFFFVIGLFGLTQPTRIVSIIVITWGLIFLPPLYHRLTARYGWKRNVVGRLAAFFIAPILIAPALSAAPQAQTSSPVSAKAAVELPDSTPAAIESPKLPPSPVSTPAVSKPEPISKEAAAHVEPASDVELTAEEKAARHEMRELYCKARAAGNTRKDLQHQAAVQTLRDGKKLDYELLDKMISTFEVTCQSTVSPSPEEIVTPPSESEVRAILEQYCIARNAGVSREDVLDKLELAHKTEGRTFPRVELDQAFRLADQSMCR